MVALAGPSVDNLAQAPHREGCILDRGPRMVLIARSARPVVALATALALALTGCAAEAAGPVDGDSAAAPAPTSTGASPSAEEAFWARYQATMVSEVDPALSFDDLTEKSTVIVRGPVMAAAGVREVDGRVVVAPADGDQTSSLLTVRVEERITGEAGDTVRVWVAGPAPTAEPPTESYLWYLMPADTPDALFTVSRSGVIGPDAGGTLSTVMVPGDGEFILPDGAVTLADVQRRTEELLER